MDISEITNMLAIALYELEDGNPHWVDAIQDNLPRGEEVFPPRVAAAILVLLYTLREANYSLVGLSRIEAVKVVRRHCPWLGLAKVQEIVRAIAFFDDDDIVIKERLIDLYDLVRIV